MSNEESSFMNTNNKKKPWWKWNKWSRLEKILFILLILSIIVLLYIYVTKISTKDEHCTTPACVESAANILKLVDLKADPCQDFYAFTCGNFLNHTILPDHKTSISTISAIEDLVDEQIRTILEKPLQPNEPRTFKLAKSIYKACMNTTDINRRSMENFKRIIIHTGGWPVVEGPAWNADQWSFIETSLKLIEKSFIIDMFFQFNVDVDWNNSSRKVLYISPLFPVSFESQLRKGFQEKIVKDYHNYLVELATAFGATENVAAEVRAAVEFEIELTKVSPASEIARDAVRSNNPMSVAKLESQYSYFPWLRYFNMMMNPVHKMTLEDVVIVESPDYMSDVGLLLAKTPKRVLANYINIKLMRGVLEYLGDQIEQVRDRFIKVLTGNLEKQPRHEICISAAKNLNAAVGALYVRNFFNRETKQIVTEIVDSIKEQMIELLEKVDWMDDVTRKNAIEKAQALNTFVAYPDELFDDDKLNNYYQNLHINSNNYLEIMINVQHFSNLKMFEQLKEKVEKNHWESHSDAATANAYYNPNENYIDFPAGFLQGVNFDPTRPQYMNYGGIGTTIGHEITHGFDDVGRAYDKNGNLLNWWQNETERVFVEKARCMIEQYGNVTVPQLNINLNGENTIGENIADSGGIKLAYLAYKKWVQKHGKEERLPALPYKPEQMFWISLGNVWCKVIRPEALKLDIFDSFHAPDKYRVNVPLMNSDDFAKDFNCPKGSPMNPEKKCKVW